MKKYLLLLITMLTLAFGANAQQVLLQEDFEGEAIPEGWVALDSDGDGNNWMPLSVVGSAHSGEGVIASESYINYVGALTPDNWLITPAVELTGAATLSFWAAGLDENFAAEHFSVYISTTDANITSFTEVLLNDEVATGEMTEYTIDLSEYTNETVYIAFRHHNVTDMFVLLIDDIIVTEISSEPTISTNLTSLNFNTHIGTPVVKNVTVHGYNLTSDITATTAAPFSVSIDGTTFGTNAIMDMVGGTLFVKYDPTDAGSSEGTVTLSSSNVSVTIDLTGSGIDCNTTLPLTLSFEPDEALDCWTAISMNTANSISLTDEEASVGERSLVFSSYSSASNYYQYLISPELPTTTAKGFSFDYMRADQYGTETFRVGYSTTTNEISAFTWGDVITSTNDDWETYANTSIPSEAKYIAINYTSNYQYYLLIDNIVVSELVGCILPTNLAVNNATAHTATVSWVPAGNASGSEVYTVEYAPLASDEWVSGTTTDAQLNISGLLANTTYNVRLMIDCSEEDTLTTTFTTTIACGAPTGFSISNIAGTSANVSWTPSTLAAGTETYHVEFATEEGEWQSITTTENEYTLSSLEPQTTYNVRLFMDCEEEGYSDTLTKSFTTKCLSGGEIEISVGSNTTPYVPNYCLYNYSYTQQIYLSGELGGATEFYSIAFNLETLGGASSTPSAMRDFKIYLLPTESASNEEWLDASSAQLVYSNSNTELTEGWNTFSFISPFEYDGIHNIAVIVVDSTGAWGSSNAWKCHETPMGLTRYTYNDYNAYNIYNTPDNGTTLDRRNDVIFGSPCNESTTCVAPSAHIAGSTATSVTVNWVPGYQETAWQVQYKTIAEEEWTTAVTSTSEQTFTIEDLQPSTQYHVRVGSICGDEYAWGGLLTAFTECASMTITDENPFMETFNTLTSGIPQCWDNEEGTTTNESHKWNYYTNGQDGAGLRFNSYHNANGKTNMLKTPVLDLSQVTNPQLTFSFKNPAGGDFSVFLSTDGGDTYTTPIATGLTNVDNWTEFTYTFGELANSENVVIVFKGTSNCGYNDAYIYLDNVRVGNIPACASPVKSSVTISAISAHSATISFVDEDETHDSWIVYYKPVGADEWNTQEVSGEPTTTIENTLDPETSYIVEVVTSCGENVVSEPTYQKTFTTDVACPAPENVLVSVANNQAYVTWEGSAESYTVVCGEAPVTVTGNTATITGLTSATNYTVNITANCGSEGSSTVTATDFTTACDVVTNYPYTEGFENELGCWTNQTLVGSYAASWDITISTIHSGSAGAYFPYTPGAVANLISPIFDLSALSTPYVTFYHMQPAYQGKVDSLVVNYRTSTSSEWVRLASYSEAAIIFQKDSLVLPNPTATYQICFKAYGIDGLNIYLDDITVSDANGITPVPVLPTVTTGNATAESTTAILYGTIVNPDNLELTETGFQWKTSESSIFSEVNGMLIGNALSATLQNLTPNTQYVFRAYAATADTILFGEENTFMTEQAPVPELPTVVTDAAENVTIHTATLKGTVNNPGDVTIIAQGFEWRVTIGGSYVQLEGTLDGNVLTASLENLEAATSYSFRAYVITADTTIFGETKTFTTEEEVVEPCATPTGLTATDITKESITVSWDNVEGITWNVQYRTGNGSFTPINATTNTYVITGLTPETTYEIQVQAVCSEDNMSEWATITATTLADGVNSYLENNVVLYPNPAKEVINVQCTLNDAQWNGATLEVLDVYGKLLQTLKADSEITQINVSNLANGMYFVRMTTEQGVVTKRFVKK